MARHAAIFGIAALAFIAASGPVAAQSPLEGRIFAVESGEEIDGPEALAGALAASEVVFLGEVHDNPAHHAAQAALTEALAPAALAFEMIPQESEGALARLRREGASDAVIGEALAWSARGWPDFGMYAPILRAAPEAEIVGAELSRGALGAAMRGGGAAAAQAALGAAAARYGVDGALDAALVDEMTQEMIASHCDAIPASAARAMIPIQRLRDAALADAALRGRAYGGEGAVVVIAGNGHVRRDRGAPLYLETAAADLSIAAVGMIEADPEVEDWRAYLGLAAIYDYVWFTAAAEREDPCLNFPGLGERG